MSNRKEKLWFMRVTTYLLEGCVLYVQVQRNVLGIEKRGVATVNSEI